MSVPYDGDRFTFHQPDGTDVPVLGWGNQFHAVFETLDGYTVTKDPATGYFHYAGVSDDDAELAPSGPRVGEAVSADLPRHLRVRRDAARAVAQRSRERLGRRPRWEIRRSERRERLRSRSADAGVRADGVVGTFVGLCLLLQFPDVPATIDQAEVDAFCNGPGYDGFGNNGSARDYFLEVSGGRLDYSNQVTEYYLAQHPREYYTDPAIPYPERAQELITEAMNQLKGAGVDVQALTTDDAGFVRALSVFYAGTRTNNWSEGLWPHSYTLQTPFQVGTRTFADYQITDLGTELTLRTFCHENGHMVCDFPDLYDYGNEGNGVGNYCLMCYGGSDTNPVQVNGYLKYRAGWTSDVEAPAPGAVVSIDAGSNRVFRHVSPVETEYFVFENRQQIGRDAAIPDSGLAIWHADELGSNNNEQMTSEEHYECSLEQADGRFDLELAANAGDVEDLFGAPFASTFDDTTAPDSRWWDGGPSGLRIDSVSVPDGTMMFSVSPDAPVPASGGVLGTWPVVGVEWDGTGSSLDAGPLTFAPDGTWTYPHGAGTWFQVGDRLVMTVDATDGLVYTADVRRAVISGVMGSGGGATGSFYAMRSPSPPPGFDVIAGPPKG